MEQVGLTYRPKVIAFDLDGTLCQHRSALPDESLALLDELSCNYSLLIVGAGSCERIHRQMNNYPLDIIGNYGMQTARYSKDERRLVITQASHFTANTELAIRQANEIRAAHGWNDYSGDTIEFHASGMMTFPLLGTTACIKDKLAVDPDRTRRRAAYDDVKKRFSDYAVFIGGSSSYDIVPRPFGKRFALEQYMKGNNLDMDEVLYVGDDYHPGGNDEDVYKSAIRFVCVDDYTHTPHLVKHALHSLCSHSGCARKRS